MEMSKDFPSAQYSEVENPQPYPPTQPPLSYGVDQYQHTGAQPVQVVVQKQPQMVATSKSSGGGTQSFIGVSIAFLILSIICCAWPLLVCTIPAVIYSNKSKESDLQGDFETAKSYGRLACGLNITALIVFIIGVILIIIFGSVEVSVES